MGNATISFAKLRSHDALVCKKEHRCADGVGIAWFVCLSDGYLIDCGAQRLSEARANILAQIINESGAEKLSDASLRQQQTRLKKEGE